MIIKAKVYLELCFSSKSMTIIWCKIWLTIFNLEIKYDEANSMLKVGEIMRLGCSGGVTAVYQDYNF